MDDPFIELETELRNLRAAPLSRAHIARIEAGLAATPVRTTSSTPPLERPAPVRPGRGWLLAALAAAAAVAFVFVRRQADPTPAGSPVVAQAAPRVQAAQGTAKSANEYRPVEAASVLYDLKDEGNVTMADDTTARRVRYRFVDTYTWRNPATNASMKWSVPRDEIRVIPAVLH